MEKTFSVLTTLILIALGAAGVYLQLKDSKSKQHADCKCKKSGVKSDHGPTTFIPPKCGTGGPRVMSGKLGMT